MLKSATRLGAVTLVAAALISTSTLAATPPDFAAPVTVSNSSPIVQMVMGDFDGDGVPDVAVYGIVYGTNTFGEVQVHFGNGSGGFKAVTGELQLPLNGNRAMAAGDVLGSGRSQLVFALSAAVGVYAWNGTSFDNPTNIDLSASGIDATAIAVGNLTTTNSQDIVVSDDFGSAGVVWIANDGAGHFGTPKPFAAGGEAYYARLALKDLNGDGLDDVILVNATGSYADHNGHAGAVAGVLLNNRDGTLSAEVYYGNPSLANVANSTLTGDGITVADVDHDGNMDLICHCHTHTTSGTTSTDTYYLSVNLGNGDGTFQDGKQFSLPHGALDITAADLNGDGRVDVVTADYSSSGFTMTQWAGAGAALSVARQDSVPTTDGMFYDAVTLGYTKTDGTFATFNNDTNIDVLLGSSSQIYNPKDPNSTASKFVVFRNQNSGGGTGGGDALPPATLDIVGAVTPNDPITFSATQFSTADGLTINVQATTTTNNAASWKGLPDGENGRLVSAGGSVYTNTTYFYPVGNAVYFRAVSSAPGFSNSVSDVVGPITIQSAQLRIGVKLTSTSDPKGTLQVSHIGDNLTYTFAWTNVGNLTASNLIVETTVPSYIDAASNLHVQFAQSNLTYNQYGHYIPESNPGQGDAKVWWNVADLPPGSSQSLTLVAALGAQVRVDQQISVGNDYCVLSTTLQPKGMATGFTSGAAPVETTVRGPIALSIVPDVTQATPGSYINYTITLTNLASYTASNVVIADPIPEFTHYVAFDAKAKTGTTFLTAKGTPGKATGTDIELIAGKKTPVANPLRVIGLLPTASLPPEEQAFLTKNPLIQHPNDNADQVVFYVGNLAKGATATVRLTVQVQFVNPGDITDGEIKNFDYLGYFTTPAGLVVSTKNDSGNIFTPVTGTVQNAPDLALVKTVSCETNVPGGQFSVILVANNRGASAAQDVFIQDRLPAGAQLVTPSGTVVTSGSSQADLNAAVSFITIGKSKSTTTSQANYFTTLDPDGTLTIHGLQLNPNNGTVGLFYTLQIPADAPVPSTLVSGTSFIGAGNGSQSVVGSGANKHILSVPPGTPSEIPIQIAGDVQLQVAQPQSIVTQPTITTDVQGTAAQLDALYAKNINASAYVKGATKTSPPTVIPGVDRFAIYYQNFGTNTASDVHVKFTLPANSVFYRAAFFAQNGLLPAKFPAGKSIDVPAKLGTGDVTFNIGSVPAGDGGYLMVEVLLTPGAINASGSKIVAAKPLIYSGAAPTSLRPMAIANAVSSDSGGTIVYDGTNVPKVGIVEIVPQAVWTNDVFAVQFAAFNYGDVNLSEGCEVTFQAPVGTEFYRLTGDASIISSNATSLDLSLGLVKHYGSGFTIFLRSTGVAGSAIDINSLVANFPYCGTVKPTPVRIRVSDQFPAHTTITTVAGAQFVTLGEMVVIPLGQYEPGVGSAIVAGPRDNFGSLDSTSLLSDDGYGSLIVAGRAGQIPLVNMPVLNSTDTKSVLAQLATIVGKHGGNIVNGPQGILLAADGESFVDNDSGSIAGTVKQMLAAGAQSVIPSGSAYYKPTANGTLPSTASVGGGLANVSGGGFVITAAGGAVNNDAHAKIDPNAGGQLIGQDGAGLIGQDGAGLIGHDGGSLIGQDGAGLIGQDGAGLVSSASSSAIMSTAQGNIVATGGGNIVATGGGN